MNSGTTDPRLPITLPNRTAAYFVFEASRDSASTSSSAIRLVAPITLVGRTALSVEMSTNTPVSYVRAARATFSVPSTFTRNASSECSSISGTCLYAAA